LFFCRLEIADADGTVRVEAEDFVEGVNHGGRGGDDRAADDGHFALVNVSAPDGEAAVDDGRDAEDESEHHDYGETVADARSQIGGTERRALGEGGNGIEREQRGDGEERAKPRADFRSDNFFHRRLFYFVFLVVGRLCRPITRLHLPPKKKAKVQALNKMQSGSW